QTRSDAAIGRRVEVRSDGDWYKARIIDAKNHRYRVHYFGYEVADDEWVGPDALRRTGQRPRAGRAR
ncbi:MAG TPA: agenet domain-containing protein, partial [Thermoanaerobaculia bacterium]|nr:agenet domain-containing protein [Thermoanaerobaculia bacterium]